MATTVCDSTNAGEAIPLRGKDRHGRVLQFRIEEILDTVSVDYNIDYLQHPEFYSVRNHYVSDAETTRSILFDKIGRSTFACYLLRVDYDARMM